MAFTADRISLEDFILATMRVRALDMELPVLRALFDRLSIPESLLQEHTHFSRDSYCRSLLCRTPRFDMLILGWQPGQCSTIHDHFSSLNVTRVIRGRLTQRLYRKLEQNEKGQVLVEMTEEEHLDSGLATQLDAGGIHQMGNESDEPLVTLHVYSEPLAEITVFNPESGTADRMRLRYSLEDEFV